MRIRRWVQAAALTGLGALLLGRWLAVSTSAQLWADALGIGETHRYLARTQQAIAVTAFVLITAWCVGNMLLVYRSIRSVHVPRRLGNLEIMEAVPRSLLLGVAVGIGLALAVVLSHGITSWWEPRILATYDADLGVRDPVLGRDLAYYLFRLPWYRTLHTFATLAAGVVGAVTLTMYLAVGAVRWSRRRIRITDFARWHLAALSIAFALTLFWGYRLEPVEYAAGIHDVPFDTILVAVRIPAARMLSVLALLVVLGSVLWWWTGRLLALTLAWFSLAGASFASHYVVPSLTAAVRSTDELRLTDVEARRRQFEQIALGTVVTEHVLPPPAGLPRSAPRAPGPVVWDGFALTVLLNRTATSAAHERFHESSLGAYRTDAGETVPVYVAPRQVDVGAARDAGQVLTWEAVHAGGLGLGRGVVAVRADMVTESGGARFLASTTALDSDLSSVPVDVPLTNESIAAGPGFADFAVVTPDHGVLGVPAGGLARRLALAWALQSHAILTSPLVADTSIVAWERDVTVRLERFAPFASFGRPRGVLSNGRLLWVANGYLSSEAFPLVERIRWRDRTVQYLRSGLIGIVDAHTGSTAVYLTRDADPLSLAWSRLARQIVRPATELPEGIRPNLPYPEEMLTAVVPLIQRTAYPSALIGRPLAPPRSGGVPLGQEPYWWVGQTAADTTVRLRLVVPLEHRETGQLAGLVDATMRDAAPVLELYRADPADVVMGPGQLQRRFARARGELSGIEGVIRILPTSGGPLAMQSLYVSDEDTGSAPQLIDIGVALGETVGTGPTFRAAAAQLRVEGTGDLGSGREWGQARIWFQRLDAARRGGDWAAFGRAYEELRRLLSGSPDSLP